ncbi:MAG TPA: heparinase II/III family protein [Gammaproteobacteria bacterium]|nr:heparinase II/III family protein [Gammaproteobacteria bacterium]
MTKRLATLFAHGRLVALVAPLSLAVSLSTPAQSRSIESHGGPADWMTAVPLHQSSAAIRPADGAEVEQTPPDFSWPAPEPAASYRFVLRYADGTEVSRTVGANWLNWHEPLPPGEYAWQVHAVTEHSLAAGAVRRFRVREHAVPFVVPDADTLVSRARGKPHPRALPEAERLAAMLAARGDDVERLLREAEAAEAPGAEPTGETVADVDRQTFAAVNSALAALLASVARDDDAHYDRALEHTLALAAWDPRGTTSYARADEAARGIAAVLVVAYDWLFPRLDAAERHRLLAVIETRVGDMYTDVAGDGARLAVHPYDSHGFQTLTYVAMAATLLAGDLPVADRWLRDTLPLALNWLSPWGGEDGGFANGTAYAQWTTGDVLLPWSFLRWSVGVDVAQKAWVRNHARFLAYFLPPGSPTGVFGDGAERPLGEQWARFGKAFTLFAPTPLGRWYGSHLHGEDASRPHLLLAALADESSRALPARTPNAALFPSIGWVAMHSNLANPARTSIYFKSSSFGSFNHSHADQNGFVVVAGGKPLLVDSGYYDGYATEHWRQWYKQTRAHNAITFDGGRGQTVFEDGGELGPGRITDFVDADDYAIAAGDAAAAYGGELDVAERTLVYLRPNTLVIHDRLASAVPRRWEWNLHALERMGVQSDGEVSIAYGGATVCVGLRGTAPTAFSQHDAFTAPPSGEAHAPQWHGSFAVAEPTAAAELVAVLRVGCPATPFVSRRTATGWEIEVAGRRVTIAGGRPTVVD